MTESQWLESTEPWAMLTFLRQTKKLSHRKARLFSCVCVRRIWPMLTDERSRRAVEVSEQYADGKVNDSTLRRTRHEAWKAVGVSTDAAYRAYRLCVTASSAALTAHSPLDMSGEERRWQAAVLRDLVGPLPFRQVPIDPSLLTAQDALVMRLAQAVYENRFLPHGLLDQARLAILADAVEEIGGADELVAHLRSPGSHVAGCWAIDLLTGKS